MKLEEGRKYRLRKRYASPMDELEEGEILTLQAIRYSRYDCATILAFLTEEGDTKQLFISDDDGFDQDGFEEV